MRSNTIVMVLTGIVVLSGCSSSMKQPAYIKQPTVCIDQWYGYFLDKGCPSTAKAVVPDAAQEMAARLAALENDRQRLADELAATQRQLAARDRQLAEATADRNQIADKLAAMQNGAGETDKLASELVAVKQRIAELEAQLAAAQGSGAEKDKLAAELAEAKQRLSDLESQLADRDKELAGLRGDLSAETAKLKEAQRGLVRALRPEIGQGNITVDLNNERLLINLASGYLFASGEDQLKPAGVDVLQRVGGVLKDFPEKQVHVAGHTDNVPIRSALKKKYPTNKELSEARANNAAQALRDGGRTSNLSAAGHGDSNPVSGNSTAEGRAKNRRVEVIVK